MYADIASGLFTFPGAPGSPSPLLTTLPDLQGAFPTLRDAFRAMAADRSPDAPAPADIPPMPLSY